MQVVSDEHTRSLVAVGAADWYWLALHVETVAQDTEPGLSAKVPAAHGVHAVAPLPSAEKVPAGHALQVNELGPSVHEVPDEQTEVDPVWHTPTLQRSPTAQSFASTHVLPVRSAQVPSTVAPTAIAHASHAPPPHSVLQHTPSVQNPLSQSVAVKHA